MGILKKTICSLFFIACAFAAQAQDPNFSQFFASPLTMNPAMTGKFSGLYRIAGNYRNQWPTINQAFTTSTASIDAAILKDNIPEFDQLGVGFMGFTDRSGNNVLQYNYLSFSTAYHKALDENGDHQIGIGFQGTYSNRRLDVHSLEFEDMLRSDGFTGVTTETFDGTKLNISYFDAHTGILYNGTTNGENNIYAGASMYHVNQPKESFNEGDFRLGRRYTFQAGGHVPYGLDAIHFSANHSRQAGATNTMIGGAYAKLMNPEQPVPTILYLGSWYRFGDAIIPYVGLEFGEFHIGATYDVNISKLKPASNMRGGMEISLIYIKQPRDPNARKLNCPKF
jgi:type IX secretion system PorP/SprF family membrane protein